jgi:hypothetical protein
VLFTIGIVLAPTTKHRADSKYLAVVENVKEIPKYNWEKITLTNLLGCNNSFKAADQVNIRNLILLQVSSILSQILFMHVIHKNTIMQTFVTIFLVMVLGACAFLQPSCCFIFSYSTSFDGMMG